MTLYIESNTFKNLHSHSSKQRQNVSLLKTFFRHAPAIVIDTVWFSQPGTTTTSLSKQMGVGEYTILLFLIQLKVWVKKLLLCPAAESLYSIRIQETERPTLSNLAVDLVTCSFHFIC